MADDKLSKERIDELLGELDRTVEARKTWAGRTDRAMRGVETVRALIAERDRLLAVAHAADAECAYDFGALHIALDRWLRSDIRRSLLDAWKAGKS